MIQICTHISTADVFPMRQTSAAGHAAKRQTRLLNCVRIFKSIFQDQRNWKSDAINIVSYSPNFVLLTCWRCKQTVLAWKWNLHLISPTDFASRFQISLSLSPSRKNTHTKRIQKLDKKPREAYLSLTHICSFSLHTHDVQIRKECPLNHANPCQTRHRYQGG